ncbi:type I secretion system ATPase [Methylobacterium sp. 4-46]|uniref:type I secretion system permease/ATPase n=1 Tax=unclassified Methylobacterium TaxID=2615210 RepID=UPI000152D4A8|nr:MULTISPECIES: type I secretion system permease/ATPase [Methylobacterium]ACA18197.1 type I secretion system ATPase [Methylobacterium sp. 4-46]WFT77492.1 type I secretion system permease/ATPase [Methylobacterium nodulans]
MEGQVVSPAGRPSPDEPPKAAHAPPPAPVIDSGLAALALVASFHQVACEPAQVRHELGLGVQPARAVDLVRGARQLKLKARLLEKQKPERLESIPLPAILEMEGGRFVLLGRRLDDGKYRIIDAAARTAEHVPADAVVARWTGSIILIARRASLQKVIHDFGLSWFVPSIWRYRQPLLTVLVASFFIQVCALITPIFFQITIDKVLTHRGYSTLTLVAVGLVVLGLFHVVLQYLRSYILTHTTSRIDVELGARLFEHLMRLPLGYFETRPAGQTVARVRELETIRSFLTGQALTSAIDIPFTLLFIVILYFYSPLLALIVTLSIPCYVLVAVVLRPILREQTLERFNRSALSSQFLIESVVGIHTVKALAVEPTLRTQWEERLAAYVKTSFVAGVVASIGQNAIQYINKVTTALVLFFGAYAVMNGDLTVGSLIAFNMIMGQVTAPILRLSQLWQDFQQVKVSIDRLGDVLNCPPETRSMGQAHLPPAKGQITVRNVVFRYQPGTPEVLRDVSIEIPAGQVLGIVGPSGSGKSTFTKLLQRLYVPEKGQVLIDGIDIAQVDPAWLRRQIGVVLQENLLFNKTVFENIALANPGLSRAQVIQVARLAGADEFINRLPLGYDTPIEERGANLSGGQRQRLAIARALATNPRILILDEATSALDYESERIIQENMRHIVRGRTVVIIAHRLAAVRGCDRIIALQDGRIVEDGTHRDLVERPTSLYGRLWRMQSDHGSAEQGAAA